MQLRDLFESFRFQVTVAEFQDAIGAGMDGPNFVNLHVFSKILNPIDL